MQAGLKRIVQAGLRPFHLRFDNTDFDHRKIGIDLCLQGLAKRGFIPEYVLDIGAAMGQWTLMAMQEWPQSRYFLLEPLAERRAQLEQLSSLHPNVSFALAAAGSTSGYLPMGVLPDQLDGSSFLYGEERRLVRVTRIDDLLASGQIEQCQFMKLDVQGYELEVLRGAEQTMRHCPLILLELQFFRFTSDMQLLHESIAWMAEHHFHPYEIADVLRRPYDGAMGQCDILFAQEGCWLTANPTWA